MTRFWVSFECWEPEKGRVISPSTWVTAENTEKAEQKARQILGADAPPGVCMTTCAPFTEDDYQAEMKRLRRRMREKGVDLDRMN